MFAKKKKKIHIRLQYIMTQKKQLTYFLHQKYCICHSELLTYTRFVLTTICYEKSDLLQNSGIIFIL